MSKVEEEKPIPDLIREGKTDKTYLRGRFYGKGGFGKCYEITDTATHQVYAGKIVSKAFIGKNENKQKMTQEINIHQTLSHKHVVHFYKFFDDSDFVYIVLELCTKRSMMELHKRRKALTEPEVRYFMRQILDGVNYLHDNQIIHRDLKLGNLFLNEGLEVKIGDFGLAAKLNFPGQRKKTLCGTPNYIAPEILNKKGHSYEVDIWSLGCIMYTLLVGKPPFETTSLRETYARIKRCEYRLPKDLAPSAAKMIHQMLMPDPCKRPSVKELLEMDFIVNGYCPNELPASCLTMAPRFGIVKESTYGRKPLAEVNPCNKNAEPEFKKPTPRSSVFASGNGPPISTATASECCAYLRQLHCQLQVVVSSQPMVLPENMAEETSDPAAQPFVWIAKWVDYSDKYGFGYQLCDDGVGVMFNDNTKLVLLPNQRNVHYIERDGIEHYHIMGSTPISLDKKIKLLSYFRRYMSEHLMKAGGSIDIKESDSLSRIPYLHMWHRTSTSVVMQLTNGTLQINFQDHTKIIMCPLMSAVTYIDSLKNFRTYRFSTIKEKGCVPELANALNYAYNKITRLLTISH